jgi:hypothetical protein
MSDGLKISWETADNITVDNLHDVYVSTKRDLDRHARGDMWMHDDDVKANAKLVKALKRVLNYYGKDVDTARLNEW